MPKVAHFSVDTANILSIYNSAAAAAAIRAGTTFINDCPRLNTFNDQEIAKYFRFLIYDT